MLVNKTSVNQFTLESLMLVYSEAYPPRGAFSIDYSSTDLKYLEQPLVMLTSFLGLPNTQRKSDALTVLDVLKNMIDWSIEDEKKGKFSTLDKVLAAPMFLYHLIRMVIKIPFSIAQIFTEFLPGIAEESCRIAMEKAKKQSWLYYTAKIGHSIFSSLHFIGRAITSPIKNIFAASEKGPHWIYRVFLSGVIYGLAGTAILGMTVPLLAALPIVAAKLFIIGLGLSVCFTSLVALSSLLSIATEDSEGIVKPLLKSIYSAIKPPKIESTISADSNNSTANIFKTIPPGTNQSKSTDEYQNETATETPNVVIMPKIESINDSNNIMSDLLQQPDTMDNNTRLSAQL